MAEMKDINGGVGRLICHRKQGKRKKRYKEDKEGGKVKKKKRSNLGGSTCKKWQLTWKLKKTEESHA